MDEKDAWYPCLCWIRKMARKRLARGRKILVENPWGSELWSTLCFRKLIEEAPADAESGELLEVVRGDQCAFGLRDHWTGELHMKPTGFMTASRPIKERLQQRCDGGHFHQPLEGSDRTKRASQRPEALCEAMLWRICSIERFMLPSMMLLRRRTPMRSTTLAVWMLSSIKRMRDQLLL